MENNRKWELVNFCEFDKYATKSYCAIHGVDESLNLGDINKVDETNLAPFNMICGGSPCFVKGTMVFTKDGYKEIEKIKEGDIVLTHRNVYQPVLRIGGTHDQNIYRLKIHGMLDIDCTDYHPFYCKKDKNSEPQKIRLRNIEPGFYVGCLIDESTTPEYETYPYRNIETPSLDFALNMQNYLQRLTRKGTYIKKKENDLYEVGLLEDDNWFIENNIIWYPVESIINLNKKEDVYNIEVMLDHTYTANNVITYNCQDFSLAGEQKGSVWTCTSCGHSYNPLTVHYSERNKCPKCGCKDLEKTRSSLLVEFLRIIRANKPNFGIYENVKNIVNAKFRETTFKLFTDELHEYGYNTYWKVLNAKNFGVPQNRERIYLVFIKKELDNGNFNFPEEFDNGIRLKHVLEDNVDEKYYISDEKLKKFIKNLNDDVKQQLLSEYGYFGIDCSFNDAKIKDCANCIETKDRGIHNRKSEGTLIVENAVNQLGSIADFNGSWKNPQSYRIYSPKGLSPTLNTCSGGGHEPKIIQKSHGYNKGGMKEVCPSVTSNAFQENNYLLNNLRIRKLTPRECFRLMAFTDENFDAANKVVSNSQLYKQAGNSIVVDVLYYIYKELYKAMPYLFNNIKLGSYFSGIGAFECALDKLFDDINNKETFKSKQKYVIEPSYAIAQRGRYDENGKVCQQLELHKEEVSNTITTVQKDSMVLTKSESENAENF